MGLRSELDPRVALLGGLLGAALVLPPIQVTRALRGSTQSSGTGALWVIPVVAIFVAFPITGFWAARRQPATPLLHASAAGAVAGVFVLAVSLISRVSHHRHLRAATFVQALLILQIAISLSIVGAWWAGRRKESRS